VVTKRAAAATNEKRAAFMGVGDWKGLEKEKSDASDLTKTSAVPGIHALLTGILFNTLLISDL
jgi:hypothetical protein